MYLVVRTLIAAVDYRTARGDLPRATATFDVCGGLEVEMGDMEGLEITEKALPCRICDFCMA